MHLYCPITVPHGTVKRHAMLVSCVLPSDLELVELAFVWHCAWSNESANEKLSLLVSTCSSWLTRYTGFIPQISQCKTPSKKELALIFLIVKLIYWCLPQGKVMERLFFSQWPMLSDYAKCQDCSSGSTTNHVSPPVVTNQINIFKIVQCITNP